MRVRTGLVVTWLVLGFAAVATAGDDPAARLDDLAKRLVAPDPAVRERAEKALATASTDDLRGLVRLLRDRALAATPDDVERDPFVGAEIPKMEQPPGDPTRGLTYAVRLLALEPELAVKWLGCPGGARGGVVVPVPAENLARLRSGRDGTANRSLSSSAVTAYDGQRVFVQVVDRIAYIADYEIEGTGKARIADPIIDQANEGVRLALRGRRTASGFHVEVDARGGHVERPIPVVEVALGETAVPVKIQVPNQTAFRARTAVEVPDRGSFLVGELGPTPDGRVLVALVTIIGADFTKSGVVPNAAR